MTQTIALVICLAVALFGASNASPYGMSGGGGLGGPTQAAMQEALLNFKTVCVQVSGSDAGYRKTISSLSPAVQCMAESVDMVQFAMDLSENPETEDGRKAIIDKYCPAFNESVACFDDVLEGVAMCGNDKVSTLKSMYKKMIHNMVDLMCKNNGQLLLEARTPEFRSCLQHVKTNVQQCKVSDFIRERPISQMGEEGCSELRRSKQCIHDQVSTCSSTAYEDIFNAIFEPVAETANCQNRLCLSRMVKFQFLILGLVVTVIRAAPTDLTTNETGPDDGSQPSTPDNASMAPYQQLLLTEYRSSCIEMSGSEEGYLKTVASFGPAMECFVGTDGVRQFMTEFMQNIASKEKRESIIETYRPALNQSLECFNGIIEGAAMCSGDDANVTTWIYSKMLSNFLELMCKDGGQIILDSQKEEVKAYTASLVSQAETCKMYDSVFQKPISQYGEVECRALKESKKCLKDLADTCDGSRIMELFNVTYAPIEDATKCNEKGDTNAIEENTI